MEIVDSQMLKTKNGRAMLSLNCVLYVELKSQDLWKKKKHKDYWAI